jgi:hypothetical protein
MASRFDVPSYLTTGTTDEKTEATTPGKNWPSRYAIYLLAIGNGKLEHIPKVKR